jgi:glycosyltransferase involved in cell wall biosynthesis
LKITFVLPGYLDSPSGGYKVVYEYANRLQARGHQVTVVHPRNMNGKKGVVERLKSRLWKYKLRLKQRPLVSWFELHPDVDLLLTRDLHERFIPEADAIIATAFGTAFHVNDYPSSKGRKLYLVQSYEIWQGSEMSVKASWKLPLHKIVVSRWLLSIAQEIGEADHATYIPLGLDFSHFKITAPISERRAARVGMLVHPNEIKGTKDGLIALEMAKKRLPALQAVLFGTDRRGSHIPDWIDYVQLPSPDRLVEIYNSCQVFLHPSWLEGWGLPAAEAMACGCALVAAANEGVYEFAVHGENALLAPVKKPHELSQKLIEALIDDELRIRLAETGHRQIQRFSWDRAVDSLEELLMRTSTQND